MPGPILHLGATVICSHGGQAQPMTPFPRVLLSGQPAVTLATASPATAAVNRCSVGAFCPDRCAVTAVASSRPAARAIGTDDRTVRVILIGGSCQRLLR